MTKLRFGCILSNALTQVHKQVLHKYESLYSRSFLFGLTIKMHTKARQVVVFYAPGMCVHFNVSKAKTWHSVLGLQFIQKLTLFFSFVQHVISVKI